MSRTVLPERMLNRALLARQGLLDRFDAPVADVVAAVGALQMQYWPALGPALHSRMRALAPDAQHRAHESGELLTARLLRGTLHTVTAAEYPAYAVVTRESKVAQWQRGTSPEPEVDELVGELLAAAAEPRTAQELIAQVEAWIERHPTAFGAAELSRQRDYKWGPFLMRLPLIRVPADGAWGAKTPACYQAAATVTRRSITEKPRRRTPGSGCVEASPDGEHPREEQSREQRPCEEPSPEEALRAVVRRHLRAFGPAAAEDVAAWIGWNVSPVRAALESLDDLPRFTDEAGRTLYDLPDAPRPDPETAAPARLLPWFDSTLLAYAPKRRTRILPDAHRDQVWARVNGRLLPTILVDGMVAGTWSITDVKRTSTLTLEPLRPVTAAAKTELHAEAERMLTFCRPEVDVRHVRFAD